MSKPSVVHCRRDASSHYCGRSPGLRHALGSPLDFSALANPHRLRHEYERKKAVRLYRPWLWKMLSDPSKPHMALLRSIPSDATLGCWCFPRQCHCDVIVDAWVWLQSERYAFAGKENV